MVSQECLGKCKEILLKERAEIEEAIKKIGGQLNSVWKKDCDKDSSEFYEESKKGESLYNLRFAELKRVNVRISEIENGTFQGICPKCRGEIPEKDLLDNPLRSLCVDCQIEVNNKK